MNNINKTAMMSSKMRAVRQTGVHEESVFILCGNSLRPQQEHTVGEHVVFAPALNKHSKCHTESDNNNKNGRWA